MKILMSLQYFYFFHYSLKFLSMNNKNKGSLRKITNGQSCAAKLNLINEHFLRQTHLQGNFLSSLKSEDKINIDSVPIIKIGQSFSVIFNDFSTKTFKIEKQPIQEDRRYCIKVSSKHVNTYVKVVIDQQREKKYVVTRQKAIIIQEKQWKNIQITLKIQKQSILSLVSVQIDTIKAEFRTKSVGFLLRKADIKKELQEYVQANLKNVEEIKQRMKSQSSRNLFSRSKSFGIRTIRSRDKSPLKSQEVSVRKRLIEFQNSKGFYLKHLKKMNPSRQAQFQRSKLDFYTRKSIQLIKFTTMVFSINFVKNLHDIKLHFHKKNMKSIQTAFLCKKFIKNIKKANKCKIVQTSRGKTAIKILNSFIANTIRQPAIKTAQQNLVKQFRQLLFFSDGFFVCYYSQKYKLACLVLQKWWRKKLKHIIQKRQEMKVEDVSKIIHQKPKKQQSKIQKKSSFFYRVT